MPASRTNEPPVADTLALPDPAKLTADQVRGGHCLWCPTPTPLTVETAVDLGERIEPFHWFPRCCVTCIRSAAYDHVSRCETCVERPGDCETAAALSQLVREHNR